ncbi:MAG TPA: restriction endonuclease subunit S [Candidatus Anaerobutyricum faecale]|nr:restriction endonuclease subunit S [Candidatus Anaerobutyricum faecale]
MTPEIKQRIEQIRQGEVPEGYQKTNVGIIPSEWKIRALSQLMHFKNGINADKSKFGKGTRLISVCDLLKDSPIYYDTIIGMVDISDAQQKEFSVTYGDILFQRSSENYEDAGTSNVYLDHTSTATFSGFIIRGKKIADYNPVYLNALLRTSKIRKSIVRLAAGAQHINIGQDSLASVKVPFANDLEQQKIATILTTQDRVIELKEKRLAEKQRQKKHLMQQLLTGKKRLPGFSGEWKNIKLCEVLSEREEKNVEQNLRICSVAVQKGVVDQVEHLGRRYAANDTSNYSVAHYGDIIYTKSPTGDFMYGIVKQNLLQETVAVSPLYGVFTPVTFGLGYFLHTYFQSAICARNYLLPIVQKGAKNTINITNDTFISSKLYLPLDAEEQTAIADTFIAADREIDLLRQDIEQEKQKKKALMQLLLTGIVRVKT